MALVKCERCRATFAAGLIVAVGDGVRCSVCGLEFTLSKSAIVQRPPQKQDGERREEE